MKINDLGDFPQKFKQLLNYFCVRFEMENEKTLVKLHKTWHNITKRHLRVVYMKKKKPSGYSPVNQVSWLAGMILIFVYMINFVSVWRDEYFMWYCSKFSLIWTQLKSVIITHNSAFILGLSASKSNTIKTICDLLAEMSSIIKTIHLKHVFSSLYLILEVTSTTESILFSTCIAAWTMFAILNYFLRNIGRQINNLTYVFITLCAKYFSAIFKNISHVLLSVCFYGCFSRK